MAVLFLLLAFLIVVVLAAAGLENTSASSATLFDRSFSQLTEGQLLVLAAALGFLVALFLFLAFGASRTRRSRRRELKSRRRDAEGRVDELERENARLQHELTSTREKLDAVDRNRVDAVAERDRAEAAADRVRAAERDRADPPSRPASAASASTTAPAPRQPTTSTPGPPTNTPARRTSTPEPPTRRPTAADRPGPGPAGRPLGRRWAHPSMTRQEPKERERLRATLDQAAELYDRARPRYPPASFADLADLTGIGPGSRVLEIGREPARRRCPRRALSQVGAAMRPGDAAGTGPLGPGCRRSASTSAAAAGTRGTIGHSRALRSAAADPARGRRPG
jgi:TolA-binding protein